MFVSSVSLQWDCYISNALHHDHVFIDGEGAKGEVLFRLCEPHTKRPVVWRVVWPMQAWEKHTPLEEESEGILKMVLMEEGLGLLSSTHVNFISLF